LLTWLLVLKRVAYPTFRLHRLYVNEPISKNVNLKGCRRVIFSNVRGQQSALNRFFTGRVEYVVDDTWTDKFELTPVRDGARLANTRGKYFADPSDSVLKKGGEYTIENEETHVKTQIMFS